MLEGARVFLEILVRRELQRIDEDAGDHKALALTRDSHQRQVTFVQIAHGRHENDVARSP
jgi:hypothetical protein